MWPFHWLACKTVYSCVCLCLLIVVPSWHVRGNSPEDVERAGDTMPHLFSQRTRVQAFTTTCKSVFKGFGAPLNPYLRTSESTCTCVHTPPPTHTEKAVESLLSLLAKIKGRKKQLKNNQSLTFNETQHFLRPFMNKKDALL